MNLTESKYYIFSMKGLLRNRIDFKGCVRKHGIPVAVSENGLNFVLYHKNQRTNGRPQCSIYHLQEHEFTFVKTIELDTCLNQYKDRLGRSSEKTRRRFGKQIERMLKINSWINPTDAKTIEANKKKGNIDYSFQINNKMDVIIKFKRIKTRGTYSHLVTREPGLLVDQLIQGDDDTLGDAMLTSLKDLPSLKGVGSSILQAS